jgi:hypothetical protein
LWRSQWPFAICPWPTKIHSGRYLWCVWVIQVSAQHSRSLFRHSRQRLQILFGIWKFQLQRLHYWEVFCERTNKKCVANCDGSTSWRLREQVRRNCIIWWLLFMFVFFSNDISSPYRSYLHVDEFASPKELAEYLNVLDKNDELYNSYFKWKGTGEFINTFYWCRVCAMLHDDYSIKHQSKWYEDINDWWRGPGVCKY